MSNRESQTARDLRLLRHIAWLDQTRRHDRTRDSELARAIFNGWAVATPGKMQERGWVLVNITPLGINRLRELEAVNNGR